MLFLGVIILYVANKKAKQYGYTGVIDVTKTYFNNKALANQVKPTEMQLKLSKSDYNFLKEKRQVALDRGLQINEGDNYVDCEVMVGNEKVNGKMRLKGHMTDHLQGEKWSFRVKTKKEILGMYRFSLQHPGTRNYVYEWIYHQLLKHEGIIYLFYDYINLKLNNKDLGIYAIEEHFGQHVLKRNNRPKGMIVRWNPNLYWEGRIDEFQNTYLDEEYSNYVSSFVEPYNKGKMFKDTALLNNYLTCAKLLYEFRAGFKKTSEVFDVDKMAKFHAIIDLVGGHHSLDWSDVKLYYNSNTKKIEPVGYESFSIRKTEAIAGQRNYNSYDSLHYDYHNQLFSDIIFYKAYIQNLERIAQESYFHNFIDIIQEEYNKKVGIIAKEWPYRKFGFEAYFENIRLIKHNLQLPKPLHAFIQSNNKDSIVLAVAPVSDFPIEIIGIQQKNKLIKPNTNYTINPKARQSVLKFFEIKFYGDFTKTKNLLLKAKILGSQNTFNIPLALYPAYKKTEIKHQPIELLIDTSLISIKNYQIMFKHKHTNITNKTYIPNGYTLMILPGQSLNLQNQLIVDGSLTISGFSDHHAIVKTSSKGKIIINGAFNAFNTEFNGDDILQAKQSQLKLKNCWFYDITKTALLVYNSDVIMENCFTNQTNMFAIFNESDVEILNCEFNINQTIFNNNASLIKLNNCNFKNNHLIANLNYQTQCYMWHSNFEQTDTIFNLKNTSSVNAYGCYINNVDLAVMISENNENLQGESNYSFYKTPLTNCRQESIKL